MGAQTKSPLGVAALRVPPGMHVCQIYENDTDRLDSLLAFLREGIEGGERCACFSDSTSLEDVLDFMSKHHIAMDSVPSSQRLSLSEATASYFEHDEFVPERMLARLRAFYVNARADGLPSARVIGEMSPAIHKVRGGSRLMEYEAKVTLLLREHPLTAVCQYNARAFDGATIMDVLKVHPMMIVRGSVVQNPLFVSPEAFAG